MTQCHLIVARIQNLNPLSNGKQTRSKTYKNNSCWDWVVAKIYFKFFRCTLFSKNIWWHLAENQKRRVNDRNKIFRGQYQTIPPLQIKKEDKKSTALFLLELIHRSLSRILSRVSGGLFSWRIFDQTSSFFLFKCQHNMFFV